MTSGGTHVAGAPLPSGAPRDTERIERPIAEAFRECAGVHRARLALRMGSRALTYAELDAASERVASALAAAVGREPGRVVLLIDDRVRQVVALLGVLKAGSACVPLDPAQPAARLALCLADVRPVAVLAEHGSRELAVSLAEGLPVLDVGGLPGQNPRLCDERRELHVTRRRGQSQARTEQPRPERAPVRREAQR
jgi:non-ribosomal peptide synthetase component F